MNFDDYEQLPTPSTATNMIAGGAAGILEHCVMYPVDSIKVSVWILYNWMNLYPSHLGSEDINISESVDGDDDSFLLLIATNFIPVIRRCRCDRDNWYSRWQAKKKVSANTTHKLKWKQKYVRYTYKFHVID